MIMKRSVKNHRFKPDCCKTDIFRITFGQGNGYGMPARLIKRHPPDGMGAVDM